MRKIEGLRFLRDFFRDSCVDCVFVTPEKPLDVHLLDLHKQQLFRVRSGRRFGSELGSPQRTCHSTLEVEEFITEAQALESELDFVIHRVDSSFFRPDYVGTIDLIKRLYPVMIIDFQDVSEALVASMDKGTRPRDWDVVVAYEFPFCGLHYETESTSQAFQTELPKKYLWRLWQIGRRIDWLETRLGEEKETVTRFNIYPTGKILLDDYRDGTAFSA